MPGWIPLFYLEATELCGGGESLVGRLFRIYSADCFYGWHCSDSTNVGFG